MSEKRVRQCDVCGKQTPAHLAEKDNWIRIDLIDGEAIMFWVGSHSGFVYSGPLDFCCEGCLTSWVKQSIKQEETQQDRCGNE